MSTLTKSVKMGVATLAIMNVTAVVSLRGLPAEAEYGISSAFYYLFAALVFLIPTSFVAAELAAMFQDKQGGVFRWVARRSANAWALSQYGCSGWRVPYGTPRYSRSARYRWHSSE